MMIEEHYYFLDLTSAPIPFAFNDIDISLPETQDVLYYDLVNGEPLSGKQYKVIFNAKKKQVMTDFLYNMYMMPVVNPPVRELFSAHGVTNVEYLPVELNIRGVRQQHDYLVAVISGGIFDLVDWEKSQWKYAVAEDEYSPIEIQKVRIHAERLPPLKIFWSTKIHALVVEEELARAMMEKHISGVKFRKLSEYTQ